jgi:anti-sigma B factor antagonist/stage II sporulation protein AA (anti-sigma F factor antagonist)
MSSTASLDFEEGDLLIARLGGEIDMANAGTLGDRIMEAAGSGTGLVLDCTDVRFMDSSGIRMLLGLARRIDGQGGRLVLVVPEGSNLWRILDIAGVADHMTIERTLEAARARLAA